MPLPSNKYWLVTRYFDNEVVCDLVTAKECDELRKHVVDSDHPEYDAYYDGYREYDEAAMAQLQTYIDYDINILKEYADNIDQRVQFVDIPITRKQAMKYDHFSLTFDASDECHGYFLRLYHKGHFKGEICMME